jgi:hypothetical protein
VSWVWFTVEPVILVWPWIKLLPDLEEGDCLGFSNKQIITSEGIYLMNVLKGLINVNKENHTQWAQRA